MKYFSLPHYRIFGRYACGVALLIFAALAGCTYKSEIRQGNDELPRYINDLKIGMSKQEVLALLGPSRVPRVFEDDATTYYFRRRAPGFFPSYQAIGVKLIFTDDQLSAIHRLGEDPES